MKKYRGGRSPYPPHRPGRNPESPEPDDFARPGFWRPLAACWVYETRESLRRCGACPVARYDVLDRAARLYEQGERRQVEALALWADLSLQDALRRSPCRCPSCRRAVSDLRLALLVSAPARLALAAAVALAVKMTR